MVIEMFLSLLLGCPCLKRDFCRRVADFPHVYLACAEKFVGSDSGKFIVSPFLLGIMLS